MSTPAPPIRVEQLFAEAAATHPTHPALLYGERRWTYATFAAATRQRAQALQAAALPPGATVVTIAPMSDDLLLAFLACCHLGLTFCHLSPQYTLHEVAPLAARAAARLVLTRDGAPHPLLPALPALPLDLPGGDEMAAAFPSPGTAEDTALLATTSGTTGRLPKLAIVPHRAFTWRRHLPVWYEARPGVTATTTQSFKSLVRQLSIATGQRLPLLIVSTLNPAKLERELAWAETQFLTIQPAILRLLTDNPKPPPAALRLQVVRVGSAPLPPTLARAAAARYGAAVTQVLSTTESGQILSMPETDAPAGSIGVPFPGTDVRLVDEAGVGAGRRAGGGYHPEPRPDARLPGRPRRRRRRPARRLVLDRRPRRARCRRVLFPARSAVVADQCQRSQGRAGRGRRSPAGPPRYPRGGRPGAARRTARRADPRDRLRRRRPPTTAELRRFCLERLAPYKVPQGWEYRETLPRSPLCKALRNQL